MNDYVKRYKCDMLRSLVSSVMDLSYPDEIKQAANHLIDLCSEYIADGYSIHVSEVKGDIVEYYSAPQKKGGLKTT